MTAFYIALVLGGIIAVAYVALGFAEFQRARRTYGETAEVLIGRTIWTPRAAASPGSRSAASWSRRRCWC